MGNGGTDILIVDDEESIREILHDILSMSGYQVKMAENGAKALEILKSEEIPAVLCDVSMPVMDGLHLLAEMRRNSISSATIMLTAHEEKERIIGALQLGAIDYLVKPFEGKVLVSKMSVWVELGKSLINIHKEAKVGTLDFQRMRLIDLYRLKNSDLKDK